MMSQTIFFMRGLHRIWAQDYVAFVFISHSDSVHSLTCLATFLSSLLWAARTSLAFFSASLLSSSSCWSRATRSISCSFLRCSRSSRRLAISADLISIPAREGGGYFPCTQEHVSHKANNSPFDSRALKAHLVAKQQLYYKSCSTNIHAATVVQTTWLISNLGHCNRCRQPLLHLVQIVSLCIASVIIAATSSYSFWSQLVLTV